MTGSEASVASTSSTSSIRRRGVPSDTIKAASRLMNVIHSMDILTRVELLNLLSLIVCIQEFDDRFDTDLCNDILPTIESNMFVNGTQSDQNNIIKQLRHMISPLLHTHLNNLSNDTNVSNDIKQQTKHALDTIHESTQQLCSRCGVEPLPAIIINNCKHSLCLRCLSQTPNDAGECPTCKHILNYNQPDSFDPDSVLPGLMSLTIDTNKSNNHKNNDNHTVPGVERDISSATVVDSASESAIERTSELLNHVDERNVSSSGSNTISPSTSRMPSYVNPQQSHQDDDTNTVHHNISQHIPDSNDDESPPIVTLVPIHTVNDDTINKQAISSSEPDSSVTSSMDAPTSSGSAPIITDPSGEGNSCHQCKTSKKPRNLAFCTNIGVGKRKRSCHKKYCDQCLKWRYQQNMRLWSDVERSTWICPSCAQICSCAACVRKRDINYPQLNNAQQSVLANIVPNTQQIYSPHLLQQQQLQYPQAQYTTPQQYYPSPLNTYNTLQQPASMYQTATPQVSHTSHAQYTPFSTPTQSNGTLMSNQMYSPLNQSSVTSSQLYNMYAAQLQYQQQQQQQQQQFHQLQYLQQHYSPYNIQESLLHAANNNTLQQHQSQQMYTMNPQHQQHSSGTIIAPQQSFSAPSSNELLAKRANELTAVQFEQNNPAPHIAQPKHSSSGGSNSQST